MLSIQSVGVHATALVVPAGSAVAPSSQVSARRTASEIAALVFSGIGSDEPDRARRQLAGQVVVHRAGLLAAGHHVAGAAEHLPELAEDLAQLGHVEFAAALAERVAGGGAASPTGARRSRIGVLLALVALGVVPGGEAERQVSHAPNGTHQVALPCGWAGHADSEPLHWAA